MAAGLGFKTFNTGDVLSAADVNGYLMQGILVFASAAARDAAITSPEEGQFAFLKDTNVTTYYTGSAWANVDTTGMTNPMTTTGDTIYSSSGSTPARLGIGTAGQVLRVNSGATAPEWATPAAASSGLTVIKAKTTFTAVADTGTTFDSVFSSTYENYVFVVNMLASTSGGSYRLQGLYSGTAVTSGYYSIMSTVNDAGTANIQTNSNTAWIKFGNSGTNANLAPYTFNSHRDSSSNGFFVYGQGQSTGNSLVINLFGGNNYSSQLWTGFKILVDSGTITGDVTVYGLAKA
jgi:hypothetical protein